MTVKGLNLIIRRLDSEISLGFQLSTQFRSGFSTKPN